mmetsp:Transcript_88615/g.228555  ORF Transcript_88615/g.228555 Transcript_88615/m.228555 type:complete len:88 (+) Transcript_88615:2167-2430(+)
MCLEFVAMAAFISAMVVSIGLGDGPFALGVSPSESTPPQGDWSKEKPRSGLQLIQWPCARGPASAPYDTYRAPHRLANVRGRAALPF